MTDRAVDSATASKFAEHAFRGEASVAVRLAMDLIDSGVAPQTIVEELVGSTQRLVGDRWLQGVASVADEHRASTVAHRVLEAVVSVVPLPPAGPPVLVACAEGEWHAVPAQMLAVLLRARGVPVAFLGASTSRAHLGELVRRREPIAVAISCTLTANFRGVVELIDVVHAEQVPVVVGGGAFDGARGGRWARKLGADAAASSLDQALTTLHHLRRERLTTALPPMQVPPELARLSAEARLLARAAAASVRDQGLDTDVGARSQVVGPDPTSFGPSVVDDLVQMVRCTVAARLVDDRSLLTDMLRWLDQYLCARRPMAVGASVRRLLQTTITMMAAVDPVSARLLHDALKDDDAREGRVLPPNR